MWGQDLEHDIKAWEFTTDLCKFNKKPKMAKKIVTALFEEACKYFDMEKFPSTDTGNFGPTRRMQDMLLLPNLRSRKNSITYSSRHHGAPTIFGRWSRSI